MTSYNFQIILNSTKALFFLISMCLFFIVFHSSNADAANAEVAYFKDCRTIRPCAPNGTLKIFLDEQSLKDRINNYVHPNYSHWWTGDTSIKDAYSAYQEYSSSPVINYGKVFRDELAAAVGQWREAGAPIKIVNSKAQANTVIAAGTIDYYGNDPDNQWPYSVNYQLIQPIAWIGDLRSEQITSFDDYRTNLGHPVRILLNLSNYSQSFLSSRACGIFDVNQNKLRFLLSHEIGHVLGFNHPSRSDGGYHIDQSYSTPKSIMSATCQDFIAHTQSVAANAVVEKAVVQNVFAGTDAPYTNLKLRCENNSAWPYGCEVPAVSDQTLFSPAFYDGACNCTGALLKHKGTQQYRCSELPAACGAKSMLDEYGYSPNLNWYTPISISQRALNTEYTYRRRANQNGPIYNTAGHIDWFQYGATCSKWLLRNSRTGMIGCADLQQANRYWVPAPWSNLNSARWPGSVSQ